jgi:hypothetical protein
MNATKILYSIYSDPQVVLLVKMSGWQRGLPRRMWRRRAVSVLEFRLTRLPHFGSRVINERGVRDRHVQCQARQRSTATRQPLEDNCPKR